MLIKRGEQWRHNIIQSVGSYRYILQVDGNNCTMTVLHLDSHGVGVEENNNIPCLVQKLIQGRSACRQERTFTPGSVTSQKKRDSSIFAEGGTSME